MVDPLTLLLMVIFTVCSILIAVYYSRKRTNELGGFVLEKLANPQQEDIRGLIGISEYSDDLKRTQKEIDRLQQQINTLIP